MLLRFLAQPYFVTLTPTLTLIPALTKNPYFLQARPALLPVCGPEAALLRAARRVGVITTERIDFCEQF